MVMIIFLFTPLNRELLNQFTTVEVMQWKEVCKSYEQELKQGSTGSPPTDVFGKTEDGTKRWKDLKLRVVEHVC